MFYTYINLDLNKFIKKKIEYKTGAACDVLFQK